MTSISANLPPPKRVVIEPETSAPHRPFTPDLTLKVLQPGQTRWNIGLAEPRRVLHINGLRATYGVDYVVQPPYLDYLATVSLDPDDEVLLSF